MELSVLVMTRSFYAFKLIESVGGHLTLGGIVPHSPDPKELSV